MLDDSKSDSNDKEYTDVEDVCKYFESVLWNMKVGEKAVFQNYHDLLLFETYICI